MPPRMLHVTRHQSLGPSFTRTYTSRRYGSIIEQLLELRSRLQ